VLRREITYHPLASQAEFHKSRAIFKGFSGPVGSGKSQALCQEAIRLAYVNAGRCGLIGAPTYPMLRDVTQAALFEILHANGIPYEFNKSDNQLQFSDTNSRIVFRSLDEYERLRGTNLAWFGVDELTYAPEEAWLRLEARLRDPKAKRRCGFAVWTPRGFDWVYRKFIAEPVEGYHITKGRPYENRFLLDKVPDYYKQLERSYDETLFKQEVMGEYLHMNAGLVYRSFSRHDHVTELKRDRRLALLWSLDFNVNPMASVLAQKAGTKIHVVDEIVLANATTEAACREFCERYYDHLGGVVIYGDASGNSRSTKGASDYEIVAKTLGESAIQADYHIPSQNPRVKDRVNAMNAALRSHTGVTDLLVDKKCKELIKDFEQVAWKEGGTEIDKDRDKTRTHISDALGYLVCGLRGEVGTFGHQSHRLPG
jgi:PBSX family phage terminase large subunit